MSEEFDLPQQVAALRETVATLNAAIEKLDRQVARAGKEQFKANSLVEAQQQNLKAILDQLREGEAAREREMTQLRAELDGAQTRARLELIKRLLPVLDGLDEAVRAGESLLAEETAGVSSFGQRVREAWRVLKGESPSRPAVEEHWIAWLHGVEFVRERLLDMLAAEGVYPIETEEQPFDPALHHAVEVIAADTTLPAGSIAQETRRGYLAGETVLRYAEVVVTR